MNNLNDNFWRWFDGSVARNRDGSPRVMYHGFPTKMEYDSKTARWYPATIIESFAPRKSYRTLSFLWAQREVTSPSFFFSESMYMARAFGENRAESKSEVLLYRVYLRILNPINLLQPKNKIQKLLNKIGITVNIDKRSAWELLDNPDHVSILTSSGYDGAIFSEKDAAKNFGLSDSKYYGDSWAIFHPCQVKDIGNTGTWDINDPRIMH